MADVIVTHRLTKYYDAQCVVDGLDLRVAQGTVYGLLGRNGAGKSTTIKMLLGMVHPSYGRAEVLGEDSAQLRPETRARIAYLAEGHPLYRWMTIGQAVCFNRAFYQSERWNQRLLEQILDHFELSPKRKIRRLSRGQQAQVALALAVATDPEVLILDDPTLGLDTVVRRDFLESLIQIIQRRGRTILFSSHILGDVERVADRIGILDDGVLRVDCPTDHFKESVQKVVLEKGEGGRGKVEGRAGTPVPDGLAGAVKGTVPAPKGTVPFLSDKNRDSPLRDSPLDFAGCPGLVSRRMVGSKLELVVVGYGDAHREWIESHGLRELEVVDFNLEDAFIEYTRGPRRSLPIFVQEEHGEEDTAHV
jgi:ABC-2 type transport system ATP-binding protein